MLKRLIFWFALIAIIFVGNSAAAQCCGDEDSTGRVRATGLLVGYSWDNPDAHGFSLEGNFLMGGLQRGELLHGPYIGVNFMEGAGGDLYRYHTGYQFQLASARPSFGAVNRLGIAADLLGSGKRGAYFTPELGVYFAYSFEARVGYKVPLNGVSSAPYDAFYFSLSVNLNANRLQLMFENMGSGSSSRRCCGGVGPARRVGRSCGSHDWGACAPPSGCS